MLPTALFTQLEVPVLEFQETEVYNMHQARCTGWKAFRHGGARNDWVWISAAGEDRYGNLRGRLPVKLVGLFKLRCKDEQAVHRLALIESLEVYNGGRMGANGLIGVGRKSNGNEWLVVDIGTVLGLAHLVPAGDGQWLVNNRIDLQTFNDIS